ncbi:MAG: hypothetical protein QOJ11_4177 [Frankiales bacterium]|jgi:hypothetical protein|nr:hypothetical protein [Frankiales bacterium]
MTIGFRHGDPRFPFVWESARQPEGRWHGSAEGPVQYLADTPDGAWAEFLRHEEIRDPGDLAGIRRRLWAVEFDRAAETEPSAALVPGGARGQLTGSLLRDAPDRDGLVWVLNGARPHARGWAAVDVGAPTARLLALVAHLDRRAR